MRGLWALALVGLGLAAPAAAQPAAPPEVIVSNPVPPPRPEDVRPPILVMPNAQKLAPAVFAAPKIDRNAPPSPVAMDPPEGETAAAATGSGGQSADPGFDAMLQRAFAERERRRDQADRLAASAAKAHKQIEDQRARPVGRGSDVIDQALTRAAQAADAQAAEATLLRPKTAPPLSDAEKQAAARRQSDGAAGDRDGYCKALLVTAADAPAVEAGPTCACAERYRANLLQSLHKIADEEAKLVADSDLAERAAYEQAGWDAHTLPSPTAPDIVSTYQSHKAFAERHEQETDIAPLCRAVASREADPRRRLVPREAAEGYEPGGRADLGAMAHAFDVVTVLMRELLSREQEYAELRVEILRDDLEARQEEQQRKQDVSARIDKWRPSLDAYNEFLKQGTTMDKLPPWEERTLKAADSANQAEAAFCKGRLDSVEARVSTGRGRLKTILDDYHKARDADLTRLKDDLGLWDRLAKRDGFTGPDRIDFPALMPTLEALGKERNGDGTVRRWPWIRVGGLETGIPIGYPDHYGIVNTATAHPNFRLCLAEQVALDAWLAAITATGPETTTYRRWRENGPMRPSGMGPLINDPDPLWASAQLEVTRDPHDVETVTVAEAKATHRAPGAKLPDSGL